MNLSKKPLYTGDPTATLTMCYAKRRRHLGSDLTIYPIPEIENPADKATYILRCKHCHQNGCVNSSESVIDSPK